MLAPPANSAIKGVDKIKLSNSSELTKISISLVLSDTTDPSDYISVLYNQDKEGLYRIVKYGSTFNSEYEIPINKQGNILIPLKSTEQNTSNPYLVIFRKSDWSFFEKLGGKFGYPSGLIQIPTNDIEVYGAFSQEIELHK